MSTIRRIQKLEASNKQKISWKQFIESDTWPGGPPEWLKDIPDEAPRPLSEYERTYHVRPDPFAEAK
jgi:hypothetical protein